MNYARFHLNNLICRTAVLIVATHLHLQPLLDFRPWLKLPDISFSDLSINIHDFDGRDAGDLSYYSHFASTRARNILGWLVKSPSSFCFCCSSLSTTIFFFFFHCLLADHGVHSALFEESHTIFGGSSPLVIAYWRDLPGTWIRGEKSQRDGNLAIWRKIFLLFLPSIFITDFFENLK